MTPEREGRADWLLERAAEVFPDVEVSADDNGTTCTILAQTPGTYRVVSEIAGGLRLEGECRVDQRMPPVGLMLPAGRAVTLRMSPSSLLDDSYGWNLRVRDQLGEGESFGARVAVPVWRPTTDDPDLRFWCPASIAAVEVSAATRVDFPITTLSVDVPARGRPGVDLQVTTQGCGWLRCRYENPEGVTRGGVVVEVVPLGMHTDKPNGYRGARTGNDGTATFTLPPGEYYVRRSRRYGPSESSRHVVSVGIVTDVLLVE